MRLGRWDLVRQHGAGGQGVSPGEEKVVSQFDRFKNRTVVTFPSTTQRVDRAYREFSPSWVTSFEGETLSKRPRILALTFMKVSRGGWEYLRCHSLAMLADDSPVQLPATKHDGTVGSGYVIERISVILSYDIARKLSESRLVEFKICNTEGRFSEDDMQGLRGVIKAITPQ